ncbi:MFS transporter [Kitasatospora sp. MAP5-34]|uniref:MFS transporter n=1 Tax=Kitasatospora sp. MAP5-34 TaxID=3035102 RepID=UPI0024749870|nr:MFS transporter [Kitasatospora sp. MAP5-34]MDH6580217.1 MFS family permease [Kitasatospora sp. MAP5-34]
MSDTATRTAAGRSDRPPAPAPAPAPVPLRRNAAFIRLWVGAGISRFGATVGMTAYPLLALWYTNSAAMTGLVTFAAALPNFLIQLPAGALVDRWDRRKLMLWSDLAGALSIAGVALAVFLGHVWIPQLMLAAFVEVTRGIFYDLAERATVRNVVPSEQLSSALAQNEARGAAIGLVGMPGSGLLFMLGRWLPFAFTAVADLVAVICLLFLRGDFKPVSAGPARRIHVEIKEGVRWLWQHRFARVLVGMFAASNLIFQMLMLTVMVIVRRHGDPAAMVGTVTAVGGIGGLAGALLAPRWTKRFSLRTTFVVGCSCWSLLIPSIVFVRQAALLAVVLAGIALVSGVFNVAAWTYQVQNTPDELQGRVNGTGRFLASGANALGGLVAGQLLDSVGIAATGLVISVLMLALTAAVTISPTARAQAREDAARPAEGGSAPEVQPGRA